MKYINKGTKTYQSTTEAAAEQQQPLIDYKGLCRQSHTGTHTTILELGICMCLLSPFPLSPFSASPSCICLLIDAAWADSKPNSDHTLQSLQLNLAVAQQKRPYIFYLAVAMPPAHHVCVCVFVCVRQAITCLAIGDLCQPTDNADEMRPASLT